jgi:hypothetical protein
MKTISWNQQQSIEGLRKRKRKRKRKRTIRSVICEWEEKLHFPVRLSRLNGELLYTVNLVSAQLSSDVPHIHTEWVEGRKEYKLTKAMNNQEIQKIQFPMDLLR